MDKQMIAYGRLRELIQGTMTNPLPTKVRLEGRTYNLQVLAQGDDMILSGTPGHNHPDTERELIQLIERANQEGRIPEDDISLQVPGFDHWLASVGFLRAGYLIAFSRFGYEFVFSPELVLVRRQIQDPTSHLITAFSWEWPEAPAKHRGIVFLTEPEILVGRVMIQIGDRVVLLPAPGSRPDFYARVGHVYAGSEKIPATISGHVIDWPHAPTFGLDPTP